MNTNQVNNADVESFFRNADWSKIGQEAGLGTLIGFAVGFFIKKSFKFFFFILGFLTVVILLMDQFELVNINWSAFEDLYQRLVGDATYYDMFQNMVSWFVDRIPLGGGVIIGLLLGLKIG